MSMTRQAKQNPKPHNDTLGQWAGLNLANQILSWTVVRQRSSFMKESEQCIESYLQILGLHY